MTDDLPPGLRRLLDAAPEPAVRPVELSAVFASAMQVQVRSARRWRRAAVAATALAAGLLVAVGMGTLDIRIKTTEPAQGPPGVDPAVLARLDERLKAVEGLEHRVAAVERYEARFQEVDALLAAVSGDAAGRDADRQRSEAAIRKRVVELETMLRQVRTDSTALYAALFPNKSEGVR